MLKLASERKVAQYNQFIIYAWDISLFIGKEVDLNLN
jgi:hypothetical protein